MIQEWGPLSQREKRLKVFARWGYRCATCGCPLGDYRTNAQLAHRIANTIANRHHYGAEVIDHEENLRPVCSLACNDAQNIGGRPQEAEHLAKRIRKMLMRGREKNIS